MVQTAAGKYKLLMNQRSNSPVLSDNVEENKNYSSKKTVIRPNYSGAGVASINPALM